jgi:hypothetical protein
MSYKEKFCFIGKYGSATYCSSLIADRALLVRLAKLQRASLAADPLERIVNTYSSFRKCT